MSIAKPTLTFVFPRCGPRLVQEVRAALARSLEEILSEVYGDESEVYGDEIVAAVRHGFPAKV